jgi:hypothetical protein
MSRISSSDQTAAMERRRIGGRRVLASSVLELLAVLATSVSALAREHAVSRDTEASITASTTESGILARFRRAKPVSDPANGARPIAEAEFYVPRKGVGGVASLQ